MCVYNGQRVTKVEFIELKKLEKAIKDIDALKRPVVNAIECAPLAVIKPTLDKTNFDIVTMEWSFLPSNVRNRDQAKEFRKKYDTENAKGEELLLIGENGKEKMFRKSALERRCLIISDRYYEWRHIYRKNKRTGENLKTPDKFPYQIMVKDRPYFYIAGVYNNWTDQDSGENVDTIAMVTTAANELAAKVHNSKERMPTILPDDLAWEWAMEDLTEQRITELATYQMPQELMVAETINQKFQQSPTEIPYLVTYPEIEALDNPGSFKPAQMSLF
ncbi:SOS response-associated peptidase [Dyadobacter chenhuakuii]|uniref:Abasic site processing protein n=1 Tax=Dyadobacter chenhuakuii TaxID=2909339 RepID=A0ABY5E763_9BACT|nr:SOS response-associated peptidase family protein [Dyadobacter chenhuakuii]UTM21798.1 SOS response-associated peptidase [Dyadobacter chenhuakuii]